MSLEKIAAFCNEYAEKSVVIGGGNAAFKDAGFLYVNPRGICACCVKAEQFVKLDRSALDKIFEAELSADAREFIKKSVCPESSGCPSVKAPIHEAMPFAFTVCDQSAFVSGLVCSVNAEKACAELFPEALFIPFEMPGMPLVKKAAEAVKACAKAKGKAPQIVFIQNFGAFLGSDCEQELRALCNKVEETVKGAAAKAGVCTDFAPAANDAETVKAVAPKLRTILGCEGDDGSLERKFVVSAGVFTPAQGILTPKQIVFNNSYCMTSGAPSKKETEEFAAKYGKKPVVVNVPEKGVFCAGKTLGEARLAAYIAGISAQAEQLAAAFGGPRYLSDVVRPVAESFKGCCCKCTKRPGRLAGKVAVVTGAAQGFGYGIAEELAREDAVVVIADMNMEGAQKAADTIRGEYPACEAFAVAVNVSNEESVAAMVGSVAEKCGGIDLFVSNAGVVRAGSVKVMTLKDWEFVTDINYNGYFLCVKHVASLMSAETADGGDWLDIVQVNSKSGLQGSNKNAAYAGGKFGGIGLTQSFALELVADRIKVNSVCPGNFFDGPLWSNPEKGLFVQYLKSGKVPGAKTVADVKKFYEAKIPMNRGCFPKDVARAIIYSVEQKYETGQAIPVTGGQVMLK